MPVLVECLLDPLAHRELHGAECNPRTALRHAKKTPALLE